jgi:Zn-dependent protease
VFNLTPEQIFYGLTAYVVLLLALSVHESAHAWAALRMGDDTASLQGRISLNPIDHIDPIGTVLIPLLQIFSVPLFGATLPMIGWAKPTPVFAGNFRRLARGHVIVAGAGPASNLALAVFFTAALMIAAQLGVPIVRDNPLAVILYQGVQINVALCVFNLIPLPPLDGSWIASWGLPRSIADRYDRLIEPYGQWILLALVFTGALGWVLGPVIAIVLRVLLAFL